MILPELIQYSSLSLLILRIIVGIIFLTTGWEHFTNSKEWSKRIEMSASFTFFLGLGEFLSGISIILGIYLQIASLLLIVIMLGAVSLKIFKWKVGFYNTKPQGWNYDVLLLAANTVFLCTGGGRFILFPSLHAQ